MATSSKVSSQTAAEQALSRHIPTEDLIGLYRTMLTARFLDDEEIRLKKRNQVYFQVSGAGHEAIGAAAGYVLEAGKDWFYPYYRDRALALQLGLNPYEHLLGSVGAAEDPCSGGRQMPCHWSSRELNIVSQSSPTGTQFNQAVGCAEAGRYITSRGLDLKGAPDEVVLVTSGEGATSEGEFWEAINVASNKRLPVIFLVEDNEYAISVPREVTTAGGEVARCFESVPGLTIMRCDGTDVLDSLDRLDQAARHARKGDGPVLLQAQVTRPYSHSLSDDQVYYRTKEELEIEKNRDCIRRIEKHFLESGLLAESGLASIQEECLQEVRRASEKALAARKPDPKSCTNHVYSDKAPAAPLPGYEASSPEGDEALAMGQAINRALLMEMERNERIVLFGQDVADASREGILGECKGKGGVFKITYGLQQKHGSERVFNTLLSEASIVGRAIGWACRGLKPVAEVQFFDYIWPAFHQMRNEMATMRYRSNGAWSAAAVVRAPVGGYLKGGAMYHSQSGESIFVACPGIKIAYPSNARDAMGLLRHALRMDDPVLFLEHKHLYYQGYNRSNDPGPGFTVPFGKGKIRRRGTDVTIVTWGALVQKSVEAADKVAKRTGVEAEVIDIRTLVPLDSEMIVNSVRKTGRLLVAHEEQRTGGFGAEIATQAAEQCFEWLDAPVKRVAAKDCWVAYSPPLEDALLPQVRDIEKALEELARY